MKSRSPITEVDLHAWVDGHLAAERAREVEVYLAARPEEAMRVEAWLAQKRNLRALFDPVRDEPVPSRLLSAARPHRPWYTQRLVASIAIALTSGAVGWGLRDAMLEKVPQLVQRGRAADLAMQASAFAQRATVAHAVYSPDQRRPVELDAAHEEQLVAWLSKRMNAPMKPPHLQTLGYALEGGRLLPGGKGPVAQFMYRDDSGSRLTLYVSDEIGNPPAPSRSDSDPTKDVAFHFAQNGTVNVFYWVDGRFGYALSAQAERAELARVSAEVYQQLAHPVPER